MGGVLRNCSGFTLLSLLALAGSEELNQADVLAILQALEFVRGVFSQYKVIIEGDSMKAIK